MSEVDAIKPSVTIKLDASKLAKTKLGVIRKLTKDADLDSIYAFLVPLVEGGEETLDGLELGQLRELTAQVKTEIDKLDNPGN